MDAIFIIGIFLTFYLFFLLLNKKNKFLPDVLLAALMFCLGIHLLSSYMNFIGYWNKYPHLIGINVPITFLYGPLLYLYIYYSLHNTPRPALKDYLHFLPFVLAFILMSRFYFFYSEADKRLVDKGLLHDFDMISNVLLIGLFVSIIFYVRGSYKLLNKYNTLIKQNLSTLEDVSLNWMKRILMTFGLFFLISVVVLVLNEMFEIRLPVNPDLLLLSILVFVIASIGYYGIRHQNLFADNVVVDFSEPQTSSYETSGLKKDLALEKHRTLKKLMQEEKPFLEPKLTLSVLAARLNIPPNYLSQIINQYEDQNFNDFVNSYRIEYFISQATENSNFTLLALALESGFNSKTTFNTVFRKHKKTSPSEFLKTIRSGKQLTQIS